MITARRMQSDFADLWIHETVQELWEPWMRHAHKALRDDNLVDLVEAELNQRCAKSKTRGRPSYPVEVVLSMLLLKHLRDMSFARTVVREVRGNLVYRQFTGIGGGTVPDEKTLGRVARQLGPKAMKRIQARMVEIARQEGVIEGVRVRMDTTVIPLSSGKPARQWKQLNRMIPLVEQVMRQARSCAGR